MDWWTLPLIAAGITAGLAIIGLAHLIHIHRTRSRPTQGPHPDIPNSSLNSLTTDNHAHTS